MATATTVAPSSTSCSTSRPSRLSPSRPSRRPGDEETVEEEEEEEGGGSLPPPSLLATFAASTAALILDAQQRSDGKTSGNNNNNCCYYYSYPSPAVDDKLLESLAGRASDVLRSLLRHCASKTEPQEQELGRLFDETLEMA